MTGEFWVVSSADVRGLGPRATRDLIDWYAEERLPKHSFADQCRSAWLIESAGHPDTFGKPFSNVSAIYQVRDPRSFAAGSFESDWEWGGRWEVRRPRVLVRRLLASFDFTDDVGDWWATVRVNFNETSNRDREQEKSFNHWYTFKHMPEVCGNDGFRRAWRLKRHGNPISGHHDEDYWAIYELDAPEDLMKPVYRGPFWDGVWGRNIERGSLARSYHRVHARIGTVAR